MRTCKLFHFVCFVDWLSNIDVMSGADPGFWNGGMNFCNNVREPIDIWGIRKKKKKEKRKKGAQKKGGGGSDHRSKFSYLSNWKEELFTFIYNRSTNTNYFI